MLDQDKITDKHLRRVYLKYETRKVTMSFSKNLVKEENKDRKFLEKELKKFDKKKKKKFKQISTILIVNKNFKVSMSKK